MEPLPKEIQEIHDAITKTLKSASCIKKALLDRMASHVVIEDSNASKESKVDSRRVLFVYTTMIREFSTAIHDAICLELVNILYKAMCDEYGLHDLEGKIQEAQRSMEGN